MTFDSLVTLRLGRVALLSALGAWAGGCGNDVTATPQSDASADTGEAAADSQAPADSSMTADSAGDVDLADTATPAADAVADSSSETEGDGAALTDAVVDAAAVADSLADAGADAAADGADGAVDAAADVSKVSCTPGTQSCEGPKLKTCLPKGDGFALSNCYPGTTCEAGKCVTVANNLIIAFDTSGSMDEAVKVGGVGKCSGNFDLWPDCEYVDPKFAGGCTRIGVSKAVFKQALGKIDETKVHMAMFRFPQKLTNASPTCTSGYYSGNTKISGDTGDQAVTPTTPAWYWNNLDEVMCVPFPSDGTAKVKDAMNLWMDGVENKGAPPNPELRANGSTPLGKTLFYVGEYIKNRVVIDGKPCTDDASCQNVNYKCVAGKCSDPSRSCRDTVVVLFTDGGESNSSSFFAPWVQAKRLSTGLACGSDGDCVGGATCQTVQNCKGTSGFITNCQSNSDCASGQKCTSKTMCLPKEVVTGWFCSKGGAPCLPGAAPDTPAYCNGVCVQDPRPLLEVSAADPKNNVLRDFNGKPFGVRVIVVDISGSTSVADITGSGSIAFAGGGKLLGADASDPSAMLQSLDAAFDLKNKKICGAE
jgi:hypothetical protein